jgi:hypothetical protein
MTRKSSSSSNYGIARTLALIGAILALVGYVIEIGSLLNNFEFIVLVKIILGIVISILILSSVDLIKTKTHVPFTWWLLLILVIVQAAFTTSVTSLSITGLGVLLELIAAILLLIAKL